jgi:hypothetical protein
LNLPIMGRSSRAPRLNFDGHRAATMPKPGHPGLTQVKSRPDAARNLIH